MTADETPVAGEWQRVSDGPPIDRRTVYAVVVDDYRVVAVFEDEADADANLAGSYGAAVAEMDLYPSGCGAVLPEPKWWLVWSVRLSPGQARIAPGREIRVEYPRKEVVYVLWAPDDPPGERLLLDSSVSGWQPVVLGGHEWEVSVQWLLPYPEIDVHVRPRQ